MHRRICRNFDFKLVLFTYVNCPPNSKQRARTKTNLLSTWVHSQTKRNQCPWTQTNVDSETSPKLDLCMQSERCAVCTSSLAMLFAEGCSRIPLFSGGFVYLWEPFLFLRFPYQKTFFRSPLSQKYSIVAFMDEKLVKWCIKAPPRDTSKWKIPFSLSPFVHFHFLFHDINFPFISTTHFHPTAAIKQTAPWREKRKEKNFLQQHKCSFLHRTSQFPRHTHWTSHPTIQWHGNIFSFEQPTMMCVRSANIEKVFLSIQIFSPNPQQQSLRHLQLWCSSRMCFQMKNEKAEWQAGRSMYTQLSHSPPHSIVPRHIEHTHRMLLLDVHERAENEKKHKREEWERKMLNTFFLVITRCVQCSRVGKKEKKPKAFYGLGRTLFTDVRNTTFFFFFFFLPPLPSELWPSQVAFLLFLY